MDERRVEGAFQATAGTVQEAVGGLTGDTKAQLEGKARQFAGQAQSAFGESVDQARDIAATIGAAVQQQPLAALLVAVAVGFGLGWLMRGR